MVVLSIFSMGKMIIWLIYNIWKKNSLLPLILSRIFHIYYIQQYHFTFSIIPYTTHTTFEYYCMTAKKTSRIELISTVISLHIDPFLLHTSAFSTGRRGRIVYLKNLIFFPFVFLWVPRHAVMLNAEPRNHTATIKQRGITITGKESTLAYWTWIWIGPWQRAGMIDEPVIRDRSSLSFCTSSESS
jgi:hypothetical protein